jgi:hypothetical protein
MTAASLVCAEIAERIGANAPSRYTVSLGKLGSVVMLSVTQESGETGKVENFRQMRLSGIEEVPVGAPRIAQAIVLDVPTESTQKVDNLVGEETRAPKPKPGTTHFALGLIGVLPPLDQALSPAPGVDIDVHHETGDGRWEFGGSMRFGADGGNNSAPSMGFFMLGMGGKHFTSDSDVSPYIGGGLTWTYLHLSAPGLGFQGDGNGLGAYGEVGLEVMRTHHAHIAFGARLDVPFFSLNDNGSVYDSNGNFTFVATKYYYAPVSFEIRVTF